MAMINAQTLNAPNSTFNQVHGNQHNYHAQQINIGTGQDFGEKLNALLYTVTTKLTGSILGLDGTVRAVVRWLYSLPFNVKHQYTATKLRQPGTGLWLLEDQRFKDWLSIRGSFLWLHGIPGSGKTVLTSTVIDRILSFKSTPDHGFAYFYADFSEVKTCQPKDILRSLLAQLVSRKPDLIRVEFADMVEQMNDNHEPPSDVSDLANWIIRACSHYADATLVLDALDECVAREDFLACFETLSARGTVRILVTSRKEKDIHDIFRNHVTIALEKEGKHVHADMEKHIRQELNNARGFTKIPQRMKDIIIVSLLERAEGMFRWVQCQLDQIRSIRTNKKILEAIKNLPIGLFATYDRILQNIVEDDVEFAQKTLSWLLVSHRPLHLTEIVEAFAVDIQSRYLDHDATLNDKEDLLEICSSLVSYNEDTGVISFSHYSVQEYFLSSHLESSPLSEFKIAIYESHRDLSRICLTYILLDHFNVNPCETQDAYNDRASQYPFLEYAAACWDTHAEKCPGADDVFEITMELLGSDRFQKNYLNHFQARVRSTTSYNADKPALSCLTNARLTWMLMRIPTSPPNWFNDELGAHGTPLLNAVFRNDIEMINFLIDAGVDTNKPANHHVFASGTTPLYLAADYGLSEAFDILLSHGADPNKPHTYSQSTALHVVCNQGRIDMARRLLALGVDVNCKNWQGMTPLHFAIHGRSLDIVKLLVENGAEIVGGTASLSDPGFVKTAVHYAIELQSEAITEFLLEQCEDLGSLENISLEQIGWAEGKPWYARLRQAIDSETEGPRERRNTPVLTTMDVIRVRYILQERLKLPPVATAIILNYAEYWVRSTATRDELVVVDQNTPDRPYVRVRVPGWRGFSDYPEHHGTYRNSSSWFEVRVSPAKPGVQSIRFQHNVHASWASRDHTNVWEAQTGLKDWFASLNRGDWVEVYAIARYPGWENYVEFAEVEVYCAWVPT